MRCDMIEYTVVQENYKLDKVNDQRVPMVSEEAAGWGRKIPQEAGGRRRQWMSVAEDVHV